jgi:enoyl-[acyl-carrier protein] reductase / trans-2-enoyl-CoA reductase (NAD+)
MVIKPKIRGFICTNAHPVGCAINVQKQIDYVKQQGAQGAGPKNVLVLGCSTGYGLASRIVSAFGYGAKTLGVCFEKEGSDNKTASAGWYNTAAFHQAARDAGLYAESLNGDAFSHELKKAVIDKIKEEMGKVDLIVYSLASPRRTDPDSGEVYSSTLKPIGGSVTTKNLNTSKRIIDEVTVEAASEEDIANTVKVMGGEDWELWIKVLQEANVLSDGFKTSAYTYIGKELTWPIYGHATIGKAKEDLDRAVRAIKASTLDLRGEAYVSSLNAVVTQASSAIPIMPLYISALFKVMKREGTYEGTIEQISHLFAENLYGNSPRFDEGGHLFQNYKELEDSVQQQVKKVWDSVVTDTIDELTDYVGYHQEFIHLFGFGFDEVDYDAEVDPVVNW